MNAQHYRRARPAACAVVAGVSLALGVSCSERAEQNKPDGVADGGGGSSLWVNGPCGQALDEVPAEMLFEPPRLPNLPLDSVAGVLTLFASTLQEGADGLELYAGVCNEGESLLCGAALQVEFYGPGGEPLGTASGAVQSGHLYSFAQSPAPISCVAPGETAMAAVTNLPEGLVLADVESLGHRFPAFQIDDAVPILGLTVNDVRALEAVDGVAFQGVVANASDAPFTEPAVSVFPVNQVGRPLGVATKTTDVEIPSGGTWTFETNTVAERGVEQFAFATGTLSTSR